MKIIISILEKILFLLVIIVLMLAACVSSYYIGKQSQLNMKELEEIVEKELQETHERQN
jgi:hypothetical protein